MEGIRKFKTCPLYFGVPCRLVWLLGTGVGIIAAILMTIFEPGSVFTSSTKPSLQYLGQMCDCQQFIATRKQDYPKDRPGFSTKTGYMFDAAVEDASSIGSCRIVQLYAIFRHGSRHPGKKDVKAFTELQQKLWSFREEKELMNLTDGLMKWSNRFVLENSSLLSETGVKEHYCLGKRFQKRFPTLFTEGYSNEKHSFTSTYLQRAVMSAHSFAAGLYSTNEDPYEPVDLITRDQDIDKLLRFHKMCPAMQEHTENKTLESYVKGFLQQPVVVSVLENIQNKLDPERGLWNVTAKEIMVMFRLCAFEKALYHSSVWCGLFSEEDQAVMEYFLDLKMYWKRAYGHSICSHMACPLITDIIEAMSSMVLSLNEGAQQIGRSNTAIFKFAHAETLVPLIGLFGLFRDGDHLTVDGYNDHTERTFRVSRFASFSSNLVFVLYQCQDDKGHDGYRVRFLVNEVPVEVPHPLCSDSNGGCPLNQLPVILHNITGGSFSLPCQLEDFCYD